jgi:large subunit ribosomal protein L23
MNNQIKQIVFSRKRTKIIETQNKYIFIVEAGQTKSQIRILVEQIFSVRVHSVNTHRPLKTTSRIRKESTRYFKRAIVTLKSNNKIVLYLVY